MSMGGASRTPKDARDFWRTPPKLFADLGARYGPFALDAAADASNHLCPAWLGPGGIAEDALVVPWRLPGDEAPTRVILNGPFSRGQIDRFARKAAGEARLGHAQTTMIAPATVEMPWWRDLVWDNEASAVRPGIRLYCPPGRVRYLRPDGTPAGSPWFPTVVVTFLARRPFAEAAIEQARALLSWPENWDGAGSPAFAAVTLDRAAAFLAHGRGRGLAEPRVWPGRDGDIEITWDTPDGGGLLVSVPPGDEPIFYLGQVRATHGRPESAIQGGCGDGETPTAVFDWLAAHAIGGAGD